MVRRLLALALILGMTASASATVITVPVDFVPHDGTYNELEMTVSASYQTILGKISDSDTKSTFVENGSSALLRLDYTFNETTRQVTSVNSVEFIGGSFALADVTFNLTFVIVSETIKATDIGGTFDTIVPPGSISGAAAATFPTEEHYLVINQGQLAMSGVYSDTLVFNNANKIETTTTGVGQINTTLTSVNGLVANYGVEMILPVDFDEPVETGDPDMTASVSGTGTFRALGTFSVEPNNYPPVAVNDDYAVYEDGTLLRYGYEGVLINDTDQDGDSLEAYQFTDPDHGIVTMVNTGPNAGALTYKPAANYNGPDSFTYKAWDGAAWSNEATVNIDVISVNDPPTAEDDAFSCGENGTLTRYGYESILVNDEDIDEGPSGLEAARQSDPTHGQITWWSANGGFTYQPNPGFSGMDSFTYKALDDEGAYSNLATVFIEVLESPLQVPGDATGDGIVNEADAAILAGNWGQSVSGGGADGDFNEDGTVDVKDASILAGNWGDHNSESTRAVPEPGMLAMLVGLLAVVVLRRR